MQKAILTCGEFAPKHIADICSAEREFKAFVVSPGETAAQCFELLRAIGEEG